MNELKCRQLAERLYDLFMAFQFGKRNKEKQIQHIMKLLDIERVELN